jgi:hypothetical protein
MSGLTDGNPSSNPQASRRHRWRKAPRSLFSTYICVNCGRVSMVKHFGRCEPNLDPLGGGVSRLGRGAECRLTLGPRLLADGECA